MRFVCLLISCFLVSLASAGLYAQKINYSEPEREDTRRTNFEIIGKIGGNFLVFKSNRADNAISIYNNEMKLVERVPLDFMPDRWINADFVAYPDFAYMIYQYQRKNVVHCNMVRIDGKGKTMGEPIELDTTQIGFAANNKIYTTLVSDDKQKIMVFKINSKNPKNFLFTTLLFDNNMKLIVDKQRLWLPMEERNDYFTDFLLDNDGDLVFGKLARTNSNNYITGVSLVTKPAGADSFMIRNLSTKDKMLDEVKIKVDNSNKRYLFTGFYYKQRRGNIEGLYYANWDKNARSLMNETFIVFNDELRTLAKSSDANVRMAFNDYFINNIITKKDGGFLLISESQYTTSRGGGFNRWDYMRWNNPWLSPVDYYYSPLYSPYYSPWNRWNTNQATRHHAENILILSFDKNGRVTWTNVIPKSQYDDEGDNLISHQIMNTGGELHFLFNQYERKNLLLSDQSIGPDGKVTRYPTLKNLDKGYDFMPRHGKQVSAWEMIVPCTYRNYLCFAKIEF
ncbi:MAG TPA: hypothetical protein VD996_01290 [Chitinophagaceae bacterium]|nr:hypothetical protein [Chitinophagaceae bacterium]